MGFLYAESNSQMLPWEPASDDSLIWLRSISGNEEIKARAQAPQNTSTLKPRKKRARLTDMKLSASTRR